MTVPSTAFSRPVRVADVSRAGRTLVVEASAEDRRAIAEAFDLVAVEALTARLRVVSDGRAGLKITGDLTADVVQRCVVTLDPVPGHVAETVEARFAPEAPARKDADEIEVSLDEEDPAEPIVAGVADVGPILLEFLALGLDPYPRVPGAAFENEPPAAPLDQGPKPFAALAKLRKPS